MTYLRLMIVYARDAIAHQEIERDLCELKDYLAVEPGYERAEVLSQDDGRMVAFLTIWQSREDALRFHVGATNRFVMAITQPRITGTPVVRVFRVIC